MSPHATLTTFVLASVRLRLSLHYVNELSIFRVLAHQIELADTSFFTIEKKQKNVLFYQSECKGKTTNEYKPNL